MTATAKDKHAQQRRKVSIHVLRMECDGNGIQTLYGHLQFQSTHSIRSATLSRISCAALRSSFNPRTPYGVRLLDRGRSICFYCFNPRTPYGVRPTVQQVTGQAGAVSIHALHTECDPLTPTPKLPILVFQSTHSIRSATQSGSSQLRRIPVSIHALHTECDY